MSRSGVTPVTSAPTLDYRKAMPKLDAEAARVSVDVNKYGVASTSLEALTGDATLLGKLQAYAKSLEDAKAEAIAAQRAALTATELGNGATEKKFVVELLDHDPSSY